MKRSLPLSLVLVGAGLLAACGGGGGPFGGRSGPDELAVTRNAPLVVPPDYSLQPPRPGTPQAIDADTQAQAMEALFGPGVRPPEASRSEQLLLQDAGAEDGDPTARATVGDPDTQTVDKGAQVKDILAAPAGTQDPQVAQVQNGG